MRKPDSKILNEPAVLELVSKWRKEGLKLVFTNGCFDILHEGHVRYLNEASNLGDRLIVGLNADASVSRLKGPHRPINPQHSRAYVLAGLECVSAVIVFEEDTPLKLIQLIVPDVLVKGGDWEVNQIVGSDFVIQQGGQVFSLPFYNGFSTTSIEEKIKNQS
ncbi:MAG: D-glycero-beta-D-manno-heptose 1-phosphate adenylyltransferase [Saprospiraceae bacterium]|nr:D-glycero-beta-D-manno-heptose 1-phosphate adenylyltransferase [Saprospiraceae bacterium]MBK7738466.1 D-glycero-beta-D-manno-heptose 1-phosphate adenylyltransferase [Saprospiraceae bacterium]MBK7912962.1 D-glycero-beta-D-manno-heptose 1-phosphate adenylyltransferase [Saprospiraceae bacterium]